jgi:HNH endonuclease
MARHIWVFGYADKTDKGFRHTRDLIEYIQHGIFDSENGRHRHSLQRNEAAEGELILISRDAQLYGHFEIGGWEEPNAQDREEYPGVKHVYIVRKSARYLSPVPLSAIPISKIRFGKDVTEEQFRKINELAGSIEEYTHLPALPDSPVELERILRAVKERLGQSEFRQALLIAYESRCAVTGYDAVQALEAAHIDPYAGQATNRSSNGLLLRGDIHTLFDLNLIAINPDTLSVAVTSSLLQTCYANLQGKQIRVPTDVAERPDREALERRWKQFGGGSL